MTAQDWPLAALCNVSPAKIEIDLDELFSAKHIGKYISQQHATWCHLGLHRGEHIEQQELHSDIVVPGSVSINGGPKEETHFEFSEVPADGIRGSIITLNCHLSTPDVPVQHFVLVTKINPYGCRDAEDNIVLPYVAHVHPRVLGEHHPLGDDGVARQMIINRHYGIC